LPVWKIQKLLYVEASKPAVDAFAQSGLAHAMKIVAEFKEEDVQHFALLYLARFCIEQGAFEEANLALQEVPNGTEGKDTVVVYFTQKKAETSSSLTFESCESSDEEEDIFAESDPDQVSPSFSSQQDDNMFCVIL